MPQEYVTEHEFERWMKNTSDSLARIEGLQRAANSKTAANSEAIAVILRRLDVIENEDRAIESSVVAIQKDGCNQMKNHAHIMQALDPAMEAAGSVAAFDISRWSRKTKVAAGVGVGVALWPAITEIAKLLYTLLMWVENHSAR